MKTNLFDLVRGRLGGFCLSVMFLLTAVLAVHSSSFAAVEEIATGLNSLAFEGITGLRLDGNDLYFATDNYSANCTLQKVARDGGTVTTLVSGTALYDSGTYRGIGGSFAVDSSNIYGGYGGYVNSNIFKAPKGGGSVINLASMSGGGFIGVSGNYLYYSSGFSSINRISNDGSGLTTLLSGYWVRSVAMDSTGIYFSDYGSKDVKKFDLNTSSLSTLISGNSSEGGVVIDSNNVYFNLSGTMKMVSKSGGSVTTLTSGGGNIGSYVSDNTYLYFVQDNAIKKIPVSGGTISTVTTDYTSGVYGMAVDDIYLYWGYTNTGAGKILRISKSPCTYSISPTSQSFGSSGGTGSVGVTASSSSCSWTAVSNATWITVTSGGSGTGNGTVAYSVSANTGTSPRTGAMTIAGETFTVIEDGLICGYSLSSTSQSFIDSGGTGSVGVTATSGSCSWTAVSNAAWISVTSGASATGNGTVAYSVAPNYSTGARTGTMTIAGVTFTVSQEGSTGSGCQYALSPTGQSFTSGGGTGSVSVGLKEGSCSWTAKSNASWIKVTSGGSGTGNGTVTYSVSANTSTNARTGTMTIAKNSFIIKQDGACAYTISPTSKSFSSSGGTGSVSVGVKSSNCGWTAVSAAAWITVTSGGSGTGNGQVFYSVSANTGTSPRTGTMTIAGKTFTVKQTK